MARRRIELFRADRRKIEAEFAADMFWWRVRQHPDFEAIREAYVNGRLLASLANRAADQANRKEIPDGPTPKLVPIQGTRTARDSEDLKRLIARLKVANKRVRPLVDEHHSHRPTEDLLTSSSTQWMTTLDHLKRAAKRGRRYRPVDDAVVRQVLQAMIDGTVKLTYWSGGQAYTFPVPEHLGLSDVIVDDDLVQAIVKYCNGGSALKTAAALLAAQHGEEITRDVLRATRRAARRR